MYKHKTLSIHTSRNKNALELKRIISSNALTAYKKECNYSQRIIAGSVLYNEELKQGTILTEKYTYKKLQGRYKQHSLCNTVILYGHRYKRTCFESLSYRQITFR